MCFRRKTWNSNCHFVPVHIWKIRSYNVKYNKMVLLQLVIETTLKGGLASITIIHMFIWRDSFYSTLSCILHNYDVYKLSTFMNVYCVNKPQILSGFEERRITIIGWTSTKQTVLDNIIVSWQQNPDYWSFNRLA